MEIPGPWEEQRLAVLTRPDPIWSSMGVFGWPKDPEKCVRSIEGLIESCRLSQQVPERLRAQFDTVRELFKHGFFQYDFFALAADHAWLVAETALRQRFLEYYGNCVPFTPKGGSQPKTIETTNYEALWDFIRANSLKQGVLHSKVSQHHKEFDGSFNSLLRWAFDEGLLPGRKGTHIAKTFRWSRNLAGHPTYRREPPTGPARELRDVAEFINCLWGERAAHGRLFPELGTVHRSSIAFGRSRDGRSRMYGLAAGLPDWALDDREYEFMIALGCFDSDLTAFQPGFECTSYPCTLLWGPGRWSDAVEFLSGANYQEDEVGFVDRIFLIRMGPGLRTQGGPFGFGLPIEGVDSPRSPEAVASLPPDQRLGRWFVVEADFPDDALRHVVGKHLGREQKLHEARRPPRCSCGVDELAVDKSWKEALDVVAALPGSTMGQTSL